MWRSFDKKGSIHCISSRTLSEFAGYLQEYIQSEDRRLSPSSEERLKLSYKGSVRSSHDPYMRAVYCILARCDVSDNHPEVCVKTDDYMWLKVISISFYKLTFLKKKGRFCCKFHKTHS